MSFYVPEIAAPYLMKELESRLVIGKLATNISDAVEDIAWHGSEIVFPTYVRAAVADVVAAKGSVTPTEIDGSSATAPIEHIAASVKWHEDTLRTSGRVLADLGLRDLADAMALKLDSRIMNQALNSSTLRFACSKADALYEDELESGLNLFGDKQSVDEFAGILIHSKLFPSFLEMVGFATTTMTHTTPNNGVVHGQCAGYYRGIPIYLTNNGTMVGSECKTVLLKRGGVGYALKKSVEFREDYNNTTFYTTVTADTYSAEKVLDTDKVAIISKTISE